MTKILVLTLFASLMSFGFADDAHRDVDQSHESSECEEHHPERTAHVYGAKGKPSARPGEHRQHEGKGGVKVKGDKSPDSDDDDDSCIVVIPQ